MANNDLKHLAKAFAWVSAYYRDISMFCDRVRQEFERAPRPYSCLSNNAIEWNSSKLLSQWNMWLPPYHYQFFMPASVAGSEGEGPDLTKTSMLAVSVQHYQPNKPPDNDEPLVFLVRFFDEKYKLKQRKGDIIYNWDTNPAKEHKINEWNHGEFIGINYSYISMALSTIETLDEVKTRVVAPLIAHDEATMARP
jgi:hypothetical protein